MGLLYTLTMATKESKRIGQKTNSFMGQVPIVA
jgi:hypothetical protein